MRYNIILLFDLLMAALCPLLNKSCYQNDKLVTYSVWLFHEILIVEVPRHFATSIWPLYSSYLVVKGYGILWKPVNLFFKPQRFLLMTEYRYVSHIYIRDRHYKCYACDCMKFHDLRKYEVINSIYQLVSVFHWRYTTLPVTYNNHIWLPVDR